MIHIPSKDRIHIFLLLVAQNWVRKYTTKLTCDQCSALGSFFYPDFWIVHSLENMTNSIGKECKEKLNKILSLSMFLRLHKTYKWINKSCTCTRDCIGIISIFVSALMTSGPLHHSIRIIIYYTSFIGIVYIVGPKARVHHRRRECRGGATREARLSKLRH